MSNAMLVEGLYWLCLFAYAILGVGGGYVGAPAGTGRYLGVGGGIVVVIMFLLLGLRTFHHA